MSRVSVGRLAPVEGLFTSESVADGHPDKIADQLSDAVLDAALRQDPQARVAVEAAIKGSSVWLLGELTGRDLSLDCTSSEHLRQAGSGFSGELASSEVDI